MPAVYITVSDKRKTKDNMNTTQVLNRDTNLLELQTLNRKNKRISDKILFVLSFNFINVIIVTTTRRIPDQ